MEVEVPYETVIRAFKNYLDQFKLTKSQGYWKCFSIEALWLFIRTNRPPIERIVEGPKGPFIHLWVMDEEAASRLRGIASPHARAIMKAILASWEPRDETEQAYYDGWRALLGSTSAIADAS